MKIPRQPHGLVLAIFLAVFFAALTTRLIPPIQSPDENVHLIRADIISHGQWLLQPGPSGKGREGGLADSGFIDFTELMMAIAGKGVSKEPTLKLLAHAGQLKWSHQQEFAMAAGTGYYLPIIYLPHATGLFIARTLDLPMHASYEVTRIIVIATSYLLIAWAFCLYTPNALSLMLIATPMALFQINSPTIDGLSAAIALLIIGLWLNISESQRYLVERKLSWHELVLYGLIVVLCAARTNLLPILLIPVALAFSRPSPQRIAAVVAVYLVTFGWIAFGVATTYDARVVREHNTSTILISYLSNPSEFIELLTKTLGDVELRRFYRDSFYGIVGWLDTPIPRQSVRIFYAASIITAIALVATTDWRRAWPRRAILILIGISSVLLVFFALAITWSNYPTERISGVQGRYFLIPALFFAAAFGRTEAGAKTIRPVELLALSLFTAYSIYILLTTLAAQYNMDDQFF